ncbi:probetacellulin [Nannospalax galili]|uniref:probetacellulin n=1 Tax=Nannospalax galili TaxID=1026970 RepID=UPI0004ED010D|nr:probetacellulin [Nannospalax galili]
MDPAALDRGTSSRSLLLALALGLVILHCVTADRNTTRRPETNGSLCGDPGENCAETLLHSPYITKPLAQGVLHEQVPAWLKAFITAVTDPGILLLFRCEKGYFGARCERVDLFYLQQDRGQVLVICLIAVMVVFIILVIGVCTCCHPLRKHRKRKKEERMQTLGKDKTPISEDIQETNIA